MSELPIGPNLVLIITDQERTPMHWADGFVEERLVSRSPHASVRGKACVCVGSPEALTTPAWSRAPLGG